MSTVTISIDEMTRGHGPGAGGDGYDDDRSDAPGSAPAGTPPGDFAAELRDLVRDFRERLIDRPTFDAAVAVLRTRYDVVGELHAIPAPTRPASASRSSDAIPA